MELEPGKTLLHLPGKLNQVADLESRRQGDSSEWLVSGDPFRQQEFQKQHPNLFLHLGEVVQKGHTMGKMV